RSSTAVSLHAGAHAPQLLSPSSPRFLFVLQTLSWVDANATGPKPMDLPHVHGHDNANGSVHSRPGKIIQPTNERLRTLKAEALPGHQDQHRPKSRRRSEPGWQPLHSPYQ